MASDDTIAIVQLATTGLVVPTSLNLYVAKARGTISVADAGALVARAGGIRAMLLGVVTSGIVANPGDALAAADRLRKLFAGLAKGIDGLDASKPTSEPKAAAAGAAAADLVNAFCGGDAAALATSMSPATATSESLNSK